MSSRILKINKKPRATPLQDIPINFPKFTNLHLELIEVKDKLKKGLPLIPRSKPILKQMPKPGETPKVENFQAVATPRKKDDKNVTGKNPTDNNAKPIKPAASPATPPKNDKPSKPKTEKKPVKEDDEADLIEGLGTDSSEVIDSNMIGESDEESVAGSTAANDAQPEPEVQEEPEEFDIYAGLSPEERMIKEKEEYLWRFRILKKKYGRNLGVQIPEWSEHSDLSMMKTSYERTIRELYLDDTVETYRTYLVGSWIVMEYVCTEYLSIDLGGFAVQQINMMYKYDSLLIELGEKSCERWTTNLPVEVRLIGMILIQAAIFYLGKVITDRVGDGAGELFRGVTGQPPTKNNTNDAANQSTDFTGGAAKEAGGKKMRGPKISADEIRAKAQKK